MAQQAFQPNAFQPTGFQAGLIAFQPGAFYYPGYQTLKTEPLPPIIGPVAQNGGGGAVVDFSYLKYQESDRIWNELLQDDDELITIMCMIMEMDDVT